MRNKPICVMVFAGAAAGTVAGLFGAGGGLVLVPMLTAFHGAEEQEVFPVSISVILPICLVSLVSTWFRTGIPWADAFPYLMGSAAGGVAAAIFDRKIPVLWLHRILGILILWGGFRYLC